MSTHLPQDSDLQWQDMPMPDASAAVQLAPLEAAGFDQFLAMVCFPPGWRRLRAGHYEVDEEFFVISGELQIDGLCWQDGQHGFVPAHTVRSETRSEPGCLAYARFFGRARWVRGNAAIEPAEAISQLADWRRTEPNAFAGTAARLLHAGEGWSTCMLEHWPRHGFSGKTFSLDALSLADLSHCCGPSCADRAMPAGPVLLHSVARNPVAALH